MAAVHDPGAVALAVVWLVCGIAALGIAVHALRPARDRATRAAHGWAYRFGMWAVPRVLKALDRGIAAFYGHSGSCFGDCQHPDCVAAREREENR
jgi:hypothetical protein